MTRIRKIVLVTALTLGAVMLMLALIVAQPSASLAHGGDQTWTGKITALPAGFPPAVTGTWAIGGMQFEANAETKLVQFHGALGLNACAQVEYLVSGSTNVATEISSEGADACGEGQGEPGEHMKVYSYMNQFPAGFPITLTGQWVIGNVTYTAGVTTHFDYEAGPFAVGSCVGVEYISGTPRLALELGTEPSFRCTSGAGGGGGIPHRQVRGKIDQFPSGLVGPWTVSGIVYTATASTRFEQEHGSFFVNACVVVKYTADRTAVEISTAEAHSCGGGEGEPPESKFYGTIGNIPTGTLGIWMIGGAPFVVTTTTILTQEHGVTLTVGTCVEVEYYLSGTDHIATKIQAEDGFRCNTSTFTNDAYGTLDSFPPGLIGTWVITRHGGLTDTFGADTTTEFKQEHGSFAPGVCVKVSYYFQNGVNRATEIETQSAKDCRGEVPPGLPGHSLVFATIDSFPPSPFIGPWSIGGVPYSATNTTEFDQEHGPFAVGACVKATYSVVSGTNALREVETKNANRCLLGGSGMIPSFKSYGMVEAFPTGLVGEWRVSGITYTAGTNTQFEQDHGFFAVGAFVEVKYVVSGTMRTALSIETEVAPGAGRDDVIGTLQAHDPSDDYAPWVVNGITYAAAPAIEVGAVTVGQRVQLNTYRDSNGVLFVTSVQQVHQVFLPMIWRQP